MVVYCWIAMIIGWLAGLAGCYELTQTMGRPGVGRAFGVAVTGLVLFALLPLPAFGRVLRWW